MSQLGLSVERLRRFCTAAARLADPQDALGQAARQLLPKSTGLSPEGVEYALRYCLEACPSTGELERLCAASQAVPRAHVLLSANVFTAPLRAIALGLACAERVYVRPSRREPEFTRLLHLATEASFELVNTLEPEAGDAVFAYGSDDSLRHVAAGLPRGVVFHAHGLGIGVAVADEASLRAEPEAAQRLARDIVAFDQRGCLSPRALVVDAPLPQVIALAQELDRALTELETSVPRGSLAPEEAAAARRFSDAMLYSADACFEGRAHALAVLRKPELGLLPPVGRHLVILAEAEPLAALEPVKALVTEVGATVGAELAERLKAFLPAARWSAFGRMQQPPFDGPVDRRTLAKVVGG